MWYCNSSWLKLYWNSQKFKFSKIAIVRLTFSLIAPHIVIAHQNFVLAKDDALNNFCFIFYIDLWLLFCIASNWHRSFSLLKTMAKSKGILYREKKDRVQYCDSTKIIPLFWWPNNIFVCCILCDIMLAEHMLRNPLGITPP